MSGLDIAIIVCVLVGAGVGLFFLIRHLLNKKKAADPVPSEPPADPPADPSASEAPAPFTTSHGIDVQPSPAMASLDAATVEAWTESVVDFWQQKKGWARKDMLEMLAKVSIKMYDQEWLGRAGIKVNGITWPDSFLIEMAVLPKEGVAQTPLQRVASLFRHETSHVIAGYVGQYPWDNDVHHQLFAELGLGA